MSGRAARRRRQSAAAAAAQGAGRVAVLVTSLLGAASSGRAQTLPLPPPMPEPSPEAPDASPAPAAVASPAPDAVASSSPLAGQPEGPPKPGAGELPLPALIADEFAPRRFRPWEYEMGAGVVWDSNPDLLPTSSPRHLAVVPQAGVARLFQGRDSQFRVSGGGGWNAYPGQEEPARRYAEAGLQAAHRVSPRTSLEASLDGQLGYSDTSEILRAQGVLLPVVKTRSLSGELTAGSRIDAATSLRLDVRYMRTEFPTSGTALSAGASARGTIGIERRLGTRSTAALAYSLEDVLSGPTGSYLTHFFSVQWTRLLAARLGLLLEAGASDTPDAALVLLDHEKSFYGGATLRGQVARSTVLAFVRHEVVPAFGLGGSRVALRGGLEATVPVGRAWALRLMATHVQPETQATGPTAYGASDEAMASLGCRLGRRLEISGQARYRRLGGAGATHGIESAQAGIFLSLVTPSGRPILTATGR